MIGKFGSALGVIFKDVGQVMLQENALTGLLLLVGIFYGSISMGLAALLATVCGSLTARALGFGNANLRKGLYGFSAALVGVAVMLFLRPSLVAWAIVIVGAALAAVLQHLFIKLKIPAFTLPFVLVTWLILFVCRTFCADLLAVPTPALANSWDSLADGFKGFGQVIFQPSLVSGLLFFLAVFISSPIAALYGLFGAIVSAMLAFAFAAPITDINLGIYGFNAVLCSLVFAGNRVRDGFWVLIAVLLSLAISLLMMRLQLTQLTFPFVLATWITLLLKRLLPKS